MYGATLKHHLYRLILGTFNIRRIKRERTIQKQYCAEENVTVTMAAARGQKAFAEESKGIGCRGISRGPNGV